MTNIAIFNNQQFGEIRTLDEPNGTYFCGKDVATALGYSNTKDAIIRHCRKDGVVKRDLIDNIGRSQQTAFIDEGNLYRLIVHSKLPTAEQFERWVFDEVLPSIRRTGEYKVKPTDELRRKNVEIREQNAKIRTAQLLYKIADKTDTDYKQVLHARITQLLTGEYLLPLSAVNERTLSASEIGERLGVSANRIGRLANAHGLKTEQYGKFFYDKGKTAEKQVETFRYYEKSVDVFRSLVSVEVTV